MQHDALRPKENNDYAGLDWGHVDRIKMHELAGQLAKDSQLLAAYIILDWIASYGLKNPESDDLRKAVAESILTHNQQVKRSRRLFYTRRHSRESVDARLLYFLISCIHRDQKEVLLSMIERIQDMQLRIPLLINYAAQWLGVSDWVLCMNQYLSQFCLSGCTISRGSSRLLCGARDHILQGIEMLPPAQKGSSANNELVTIIMSCHNAESTVGYAIESILEQSYDNFELIIVDDASTDETAEIIAEYGRRDRRIAPIYLDANRGPYEGRNIAVGRASGVYVTTHDSDDLCHPDRIRKQVKSLRSQPQIAAVIGQWLRIGPHGHVLYHNKRGGAFLHGGLATMMYRRDVLKLIGYYDHVRYSADTEFLFRLRKVYGADSVISINEPLVLAAHSKSSLTGCTQSRADSFLGDCESRALYRNAWEEWHSRTDPKDLFMPLEVDMRMFPAPEEMLVGYRS